MKPFLLLYLCLVLSACATKVTVSEPLLISGETVLIRGNITEMTAREFKEALHKERISRILLASGGGYVEPSIEIAKEIWTRKLDVEVVGNCFSSCANYIFPAGANKTISGLGVVAWHGNMNHLLHLHDNGKKHLSVAALAEVRRLAILENEFFKGIGLDEYLCWFAKVEPYNVRNLYFLNPEDMAQFGLTGVNVRPGYANTDVSSHNSEGVENLRYVKVNWPSFVRVVQPQ